MIGGSGEQLTLRAVARWGDACNIFGDPDMVRKKFDVLRQHCENEGRDYNSIERTNLTALLVARDEAGLKTKKERLQAPEPFRGLALTTTQAADLVGRYEQVGSQMVIASSYKNDPETLELLASDVIPHFTN